MCEVELENYVDAAISDGDVSRLKHIKNVLIGYVTILDDALYDISQSYESNVFETHEGASDALSEKMRNWAFDDCEGAYNVGQKEYECGYIVDGVKYIATGTFEYDRHDKTYYYIDSFEYCYRLA